MQSPKDLLDRVKKNKDKSSNEVLKEVTTGTTTGGIIGGAAGLILAISYKKNYLAFATIGILAGGLISNVFIKKEINKPKPKK